jgi:hypothetical protein
MSLLPLFEALGRSAPGVFLRDSTLAFALTEALHLLALSLVGGIVTVTCFGTAGVLIGRAQAAALGRGLRPLFAGALLFVVATGLLLVAAGPYKYYSNPVFWVKMDLLAIAVMGYVLLDRRLARSPTLPGAGWRLWALALAGLWLSVAIAGRAIGLI